MSFGVRGAGGSVNTELREKTCKVEEKRKTDCGLHSAAMEPADFQRGMMANSVLLTPAPVHVVLLEEIQESGDDDLDELLRGSFLGVMAPAAFLASVPPLLADGTVHPAHQHDMPLFHAARRGAAARGGPPPRHRAHFGGTMGVTRRIDPLCCCTVLCMAPRRGTMLTRAILSVVELESWCFMTP